MSLLDLAGLEAASGREELTRRLQDAYRSAWRTLKLEHDGGLDSLEVIAQLTRLMDEVISFVYRRTLEDMSREGVRPDAGLALLALGSYGRKELSPHSDVDLLFLVSESVNPSLNSFTERVLYLLWDTGLDVGYSVRTQKDCFSLSQDNYDVLTSLLDARFLQGDVALLKRFQKEFRKKVLDKVGSDFVHAKLEAMGERLKKHGGTIYVLEPNVKEGMGGLRDIHTALWVAKVLFDVESLHALSHLEDLNVLDQKDYRTLKGSFDFLLRLRCSLHFASSTARDILSMEKQAWLAERLGVRARKGAPAVERLMQEYYSHANRVHQITDSIIRRSLERKRRTPKILMRWREKDLGEGYFSREGALYTRMDPVRWFKEDPSRMMEVFYRYQRSNLEMWPELVLGVRRSLLLVNSSFRKNPKARNMFFRILGKDRRLYETLLLMNELRFLGKYLPEFATIHCKMQHDYYHTYTVDEHSIRAIRELVELSKDADPNMGLYRQVYDEVQGQRHLLLVTVLLHDVGKGQGPGHAERGAVMAGKAAMRLGLTEEDVDAVTFLVRHHLLLSHVAQRRDLHEEKTIVEVASSVGTGERLKLLFLLTMADLKAVGPGVWNEWKASLISELFLETVRVLQTGGGRREDLLDRIDKAGKEIVGMLGEEFDEGTIRAELANLGERAYLVYDPPSLAHMVGMRLRMEDRLVSSSWRQSKRGGYTDLYVVAKDHPGLFSKIAGVLSANNVNILGAQILTRGDGMAFDRLQVTDSVMKPITDRMKFRIVNRELEKVFSGELSVEDLFRTRKLSLPLDRRDRVAVQAPNRVEIDNQASEAHTVIDVYAVDRIGLLYTITSTLAALGLSISTAKVSTKVDQAVDVFYVTDVLGRKVTDEGEVERIRRTLMDALEEGRSQAAG